MQSPRVAASPHCGHCRPALLGARTADPRAARRAASRRWARPALARALLAAAAFVCAGAAEAAASPHLSWSAPGACPDSESVSRRLSEVLRGSEAERGAGWHVRGAVEPRGRGWRLALGIDAPGEPAGGNERLLTARDCDELTDAAVVAIAIAIGGAPLLAAPPAVPQPPTPAAASAPSPAADRGPARQTLARRASPPLNLELGARAVLDSASLGGLSGGPSLELEGWRGSLGLGLYAFGLLPRQRAIAEGQRAEFFLLGGGARGCLGVPADWLEVRACAGAELGRFDARSQGLLVSRHVSDLWLAPTVGIELGSRVLGGLSLSARVELAVPVRRQEYLIDLEQPVHRVPPATLRGSIGVAAPL